MEDTWAEVLVATAVFVLNVKEGPIDMVNEEGSCRSYEGKANRFDAQALGGHLPFGRADEEVFCSSRITASFPLCEEETGG